VISGLAAACFVVFVIVRDPGERPAPVAAMTERKVLTVINFPAAEVAATEAQRRPTQRRPPRSPAPAVVAVIPKSVPVAADSALGLTNAQVTKNLAAIGKDLSLLGQTGTLPRGIW